MSALFDGLSGSPTTSNEGVVFTENGDQLALLADVGNALAFGSEAEEELGQTSAGSLVVQVRLNRSLYFVVLDVDIPTASPAGRRQTRERDADLPTLFVWKRHSTATRQTATEPNG